MWGDEWNDKDEEDDDEDEEAIEAASRLTVSETTTDLRIRVQTYLLSWFYSKQVN